MLGHYVSNMQHNVVAMLADYLDKHCLHFSKMLLMCSNSHKHNIYTKNCLIESVFNEQLTTEAPERKKHIVPNRKEYHPQVQRARFTWDKEQCVFLRTFFNY